MQPLPATASLAQPLLSLLINVMTSDVVIVVIVIYNSIYNRDDIKYCLILCKDQRQVEVTKAWTTQSPSLAVSETQ
jgi:hypothetical protein